MQSAEFSLVLGERFAVGS